MLRVSIEKTVKKIPFISALSTFANIACCEREKGLFPEFHGIFLNKTCCVKVIFIYTT